MLVSVCRVLVRLHSPTDATSNDRAVSHQVACPCVRVIGMAYCSHAHEAFQIDAQILRRCEAMRINASTNDATQHTVAEPLFTHSSQCTQFNVLVV
jgi:hypothetical protein